MSNSTQDIGFILIVDDNPTNLSVLAQTLKGAGLNIRIQTDGESALQQLEDDSDYPELILLDVEMPGINGFETCRRIKENPKTQDIPIIFMTALSDTESKVKGLSLGAVDYITKPFEGEEVLARVRVHLQIRTLTRNQKQWNEQLEQRVAERTAALQQAQVQLVQKEKLATLGELVAGVAHEINNPISCIAGNIPLAYEYVEDLIKIIKLYQTHCPLSNLEIEQALEEVDLEFTLEDLFKIIESIQLSSDRIKDISVSLRNFSRLDTDAKVLANLHEGLDSTLVILRHRLKAVGNRPAIEVIKEYGNIPEVECYPGLLNQAFMNLLANAIDALEDDRLGGIEKGEKSCNDISPMIRLGTEIAGDRVIIRIADNGGGMSEEVQKQLFKPLFTTKPLGKGTGLGLSIVRQVVEEKHHGKLSFVSEWGKGCEFTIALRIADASALPLK
jgi:signal transduction histidine kinase